MRLLPFLLAALSLALSHNPSRAQERKPLHIAIVVGENKSKLLTFKEYLEKSHGMKVSIVEVDSSPLDKETKKNVETPAKNIEALAECDVIVSNMYRTWLPADQLEVFKKRFTTKPVVGLRKAHHGFQNWLAADMEVFGVKYKGHYFGKDVAIEIVEKHKSHPFFEGFKPYLPGGGLYGHTDVAPDVEVLMVGAPAGKTPMPQMWMRTVKEQARRRAVYTRYDPSDLMKDEPTRAMVTRAIRWASN